MNPTEKIDILAVTAAVERVCAALQANQQRILDLDQAAGDGDLGITAAKISAALRIYIQKAPQDDLGKWLAGAGMETNRAGSSTMGTLLATALMRMGREVMGKTILDTQDLAHLAVVAGNSMRERGKANLGNKTVLDAIIPAGVAFRAALETGSNLREAGLLMLRAAENGRDAVTPLQSRIGRSSWLGERTLGLVDAGCEMMVILLRAIVAE
jgi:phosphoenolpyruvate---glycerone phosphotransferase subunit DhaL